MIVRFKPHPERLRCYLVGHLRPHIESFATLLSQRGYGSATGWRKIGLVAELSRWLERKHIRLKILDERLTNAFLRGEGGGPLHYQLAWEWFRVAAAQAGLRQLGGGRGGPRIHDLRHYFAIRTLLNWYRCNADVDAQLPQLATFLGHVHVNDTFWYISAVPELLDLATRRWEGAEKGEK